MSQMIEKSNDMAIQIARNMIAGGKLSFEEIAQYSELPMEMVLKLAKKESPASQNMYFSDLLRQVGLNPAKVKLIRHAYSNYTFRLCAESGMIFEYTRHQKKGFNKGFKYWCVFVSGAHTLADFYALYKVGDSIPDTPNMIPDGLPGMEANKYKGNAEIYNLEPIDLLKEYENKLTIEWGNSTRSWHQSGANEKLIV